MLVEAASMKQADRVGQMGSRRNAGHLRCRRYVIRRYKLRRRSKTIRPIVQGLWALTLLSISFADPVPQPVDSGAYLNPAITFCSCLFRQLPWRRFPIYFIAQVLGAFVGSGIVYANYISAIDFVEGHGIRTVPPAPKATAGIFCTYPQAYLTKTGQFFSEFIASAILMFVIFALKDPNNNGVGKVWLPALRRRQ